MGNYIERVLADVKLKNKHESEFIQAVEELFHSIKPVVESNEDYEKHAILERMVEPDRVIEFRVTWTDDQQRVHVNRGYRVQFNGAIGPYKGGLRFHPSVNLSIMKFLAFEQTYKNALTTLAMGGAKGGSDFDPRGRSDAEIMRFCQSYMTELYRHIGADMDIPAGDIGVSQREVGYLFGQYRRIMGSYENGVITGKALEYGGSVLRPEATGFGAAYFANEVLNHQQDTLEGKTVIISGFGNVAWGVCQKMTELGAKVVTLSGPDGYIYDLAGINTQEKFDYLLEMRQSGNDRVQDYADRFGVEFIPGKKPWERPADIAMPCATQNEIDIEEAKQLIENDVKYLFEVSNMPTTNEAMAYLFENSDIIMAPSKAVNAGGVAGSGIEMSQNASMTRWNSDRVDQQLQTIMKGIHQTAVSEAKKYGFGYDLIAGANIAGFKKVAKAMMQLGVY